ncbi:MAG TPA: TetR/AcrR family transcriptional regulator [Candidatus Ruania gallistercoris]|uniref:TetR/AcrR family transcriptional regulator n=1 Tax=Candidatus Ruania gallistercoris TaxID=2838746 RepID=A0A9D2EGZ3_9MICO|nr:TetR/AcrR family transcriptional regulator [Candidatus Ruania gallistercoris]
MAEEAKPRRRGPYAKSAYRRRSIVAAAFAVFAANGYRGGSLQDVADRVGLSQTALLHYFPTKRDLLVAVLARRDEVSDSSQLEGMPFQEQLVEQAHLNERVPGLIELYAVLCGESVTDDYPGRPYFVQRFDRLRSEYADELRELQLLGKLREGIDPERAAASLIALWDGLQTQWLLNPAIDVAAGLRDYLELIIPPDQAGPAA